MGHPGFTVITDHEPLKGIFRKDLNAIITKRLQCFRKRLMPYVFNLNWYAGKLHLIADTFSRAPVSPPEPSEDSTLRQVSAIDASLESTIRAAAKDENYRKVLDAILELSLIHI